MTNQREKNRGAIALITGWLAGPPLAGDDDWPLEPQEKTAEGLVVYCERDFITVDFGGPGKVLLCDLPRTLFPEDVKPCERVALRLLR